MQLPAPHPHESKMSSAWWPIASAALQIRRAASRPVLLMFLKTSCAFRGVLNRHRP
jgi:hypothetical protein